MKFQFDPNLDFQHEAINAVVDLFDGQEVCQTNFTVAPLKHDPQAALPGMANEGRKNEPVKRRQAAFV